MKNKEKENSREPDYKKITTIAGAVVALVSLVLNIYLGVSNLKLQQDKADFEKEINSVRLDNERLDLLVRKNELEVDLEARYFVVSGLALFDIQRTDPIDPNADLAIVQTQVLSDLESWLQAWSTGESPISGEDGVTREHGVVLYRISNRGTQNAQQLVATVNWKDFSNEGEVGDNIWELKTEDWQETTIRLADLLPGQSVTIPIAHILGTNTYFGRVIEPIKIDWFNPALKEEEFMQSQGMAPEDQWISRGLNISVGQ